LVGDAEFARNTEMLGYTQYSLQPQAVLDFKWTKLNLQVGTPYWYFLQLIRPYRTLQQKT